MLEELHRVVAKEREIPLLIRIPILMASGVVFQSLLYMDTTERWYKIGQNALFAALTYEYFNNSAKVAVALGHSLGFVTNGHFPVVLKNTGVLTTSSDRFRRWQELLETVGERTSSISAIGVYGSLSRSELGPESDLDVRVVRRPGIFNAIQSCLVINLLRLAATATLFPLDIYLLDSVEPLEELQETEHVLVISDKDTLFG